MAETARVITTFGRRSAIATTLITGVAFIYVLSVLTDPQLTQSMSRKTLVMLDLCVVVFAVAALLSALQIARPSRLVLTEEGFQLLWLRSLPLIGWGDIDAFGLVRQVGGAHVAFRLTEPASARIGSPWWRMLAPKGYDGILYTGPQGASGRVLGELEEWRRRYGLSVAEPQL